MKALAATVATVGLLTGVGGGSAAASPTRHRELGARSVASAASIRVKFFVKSGESVSCPQGTVACVVTVRGEARAVAAGGHGKRARHRKQAGRRKVATRVVAIGNATITVAPGATVMLSFRLNQIGVALIRGHRSLPVKLTVAVRQGSGPPIVFTHRVAVAGLKRRG